MIKHFYGWLSTDKVLRLEFFLKSGKGKKHFILFTMEIIVERRTQHWSDATVRLSVMLSCCSNHQLVLKYIILKPTNQ